MDPKGVWGAIGKPPSFVTDLMEMKTIVIPEEAAGMRAGDFLRFWLPDLPESTLRKVFAARDVKLDQARVSRDTPVTPGQQMRVYLPADAAPPELDIVWEDEDILLINKRAGISVEGEGGTALSLTDLCRRRALEKDPDAFPPAPCHRLDTRTCGLCLFAKNPCALDILLRAFRDRTLEKHYICLVRGVMKPPQAECHAWLLKDADQARVRILDRQVPGARPIITGYETLSSGPVSRLRVHLITGRTHQIRAHLAAMGHPILGDDLYGDRDFNRLHKARTLKLCAVSLTLDTGGQLPALDGRTFEISPPF